MGATLQPAEGMIVEKWSWAAGISADVSYDVRTLELKSEQICCFAHLGWAESVLPDVMAVAGEQ